MKSNNQLLLRSSGGNAAVFALIAAVALLVELVLARVLGKNAYGIYVFAITITGFLVLAARAGIDLAIVRFIPGYIAREQWDKARGLLQFSQWFVVAMSAATFVITYFVIILYVRNHNPELADTLFFSAWLVPGLALGIVYQASARAFKVVVLPQFILHVLPSLFLVGTIYAMHGYTTRMMSAHDAALYKSILTFLAMLMLMIMYKSMVPVQTRKAQPSYLIKEWMGTGAAMFSIMIMSQLVLQIGTLQLGWLIHTDTAGIYNAANKIAQLAAFPFMAVNMLGATLIAELYASGRIEELRSLLRRITRITFAGTAIIVLGLAVFGKWFLSLFGQDFTDAYIPLCILLAGHLFIALSGPLLAVMAQAGKHIPASIIVGCSVILSLILNFILIPKFGMYGAATASSFVWIFQRLAASAYMRKQAGLNRLITSLFQFKGQAS